MQARASGYMLAGTLSLASMGAVAHLLGESLHWSAVVFVRIFATFVLAMLYARIAKVPLVFNGPVPLWTRSFFGTVAIICNFYALTHLTVTDALTLLKTSPIWVGILTAILHKRSHSGRVWVSLVLGVAGVVMMEQPKFEGHWFPILVAVCSALFIASAQVSMTYLSELSTVSVVVHFSGFASLAAAGMVVATGAWRYDGAYAGGVGWWLVVLALLGTVGQVMMTNAFRRGNAMLLSLIGLLAIPVAVLYDFFLWDRRLGRMELAGIGLIAVSIILCAPRSSPGSNGSITSTV